MYFVAVGSEHNNTEVFANVTICYPSRLFPSLTGMYVKQPLGRVCFLMLLFFFFLRMYGNCYESERMASFYILTKGA
jgi:hypothetical protein